MAILNHGSTLRTADGGQSTTTIVTANNIGSYAPALNSTYYVGTTQNVFNRASAAQTLTGVSIDGNAANITAYTINQNVGTANAPSFAGITSTSTIVVSDNTAVNFGNTSQIYHNSARAATQFTGTGGADTMCIKDASGNVGIGTTSPSQKFHVSGIGYSDTDFRAPIFYDSNNTAYYIDPASTSNLVGLTVANTITGSISGNAATATNATQLGGVAAANYVRNDVDGTDSTALFRLTTITKSLTITTSWLDTGIIGANLATGCYMISVYVDNYAVSGGHYQETYTGMMSWFSTGTNSTDYDEIVLHKSGHASNGAYINLRTIRQLSGGTNLKLQIISSVSTSGASNYVFKFRRLI